MPRDEAAACPCGRLGERGRPLAYEACCGRYLDHWGGHPAPDAESLMRSRYTAFVRGREDYLLATWDAADRPGELDRGLDPDSLLERRQFERASG